jgi:2,4-dienoyl-CoA reductase [(3E)-enoyl-CoA-producing], peroxisomal
VIDIDLLGAFNTMKATMPYLVESAKRNPNPSNDGLTGGRIIFISATFHFTGAPLQAHAAAAKAGIDALSASVALEYGPLGVTSNIVTPGAIAGTEGMLRLSSPDSLARVSRQVPIGRMGNVRDIADATVYLFSDAGNYVNGEVLVVDGALWRMGATGTGTDENMKYPDFLIDGVFSKGVKSGRREKPTPKL